MMQLSGPNGTKNQVFRHRTNVGLKDKAVNERLALEREGLEVPDYFVGGESLLFPYREQVSCTDSSADTSITHSNCPRQQAVQSQAAASCDRD